jgi:hypothetical protein
MFSSMRTRWAFAGLPVNCMLAMLVQLLAMQQGLGWSCIASRSRAARHKSRKTVQRHRSGSARLDSSCCWQVTGIAVAPEVSATTAASSSADGSVKLWAGSEGGGLRVLATLKGHAGRVHSVGWRSGAHELVSAAQVWNAFRGRLGARDRPQVSTDYIPRYRAVARSRSSADAAGRQPVQLRHSM